jgi:hypothetical protein
MQRADFKPLQFSQQLLISGERHVKFLSDLNLRWETVKLGGKGLDGPLNSPPLAP